METKNLETLKIHRLSQAQYDRELEAGNIDENAIYLTPEERIEYIPTPKLPRKRKWKSVCYGNGVFVACSNGDDFEPIGIAYSTDGATWTKTNGVSEEGYYDCACYGNGKFVVFGENIGGGKGCYSTDGIHWTKFEECPAIENGVVTSVCYGNGKFVAVTAEGDDFLIYSEDGIHWNTAENPVSPHNFYAVCYGNGRFLAVGRGNQCICSIDGIHWQESPLPLSSIYRSICYGNGVFITVESDGNEEAPFYTYAEEEGSVEWYEATGVDSGTNAMRVCYGNGKFIAYDTVSGIVACSTDGINWTQYELEKEFPEWLSMCYGNGKYIAVGDSDKVAYSFDGIRWSDEAHLSDNASGLQQYIDDRILGAIGGSY